MPDAPTSDITPEKLQTWSRPAVLVGLLLFALPFTSIQCQGKRLATVKGYELVIGTTVTIENPMPEGGNLTINGQPAGGPNAGGPEVKMGDKEQKIDPEPGAIIALAAAVVGLAFSMIGLKRAKETGMLFAAAAIALLLCDLMISDKLTQESGGLARSVFSIWLWLAFLLFGGAAGANFWAFYKDKERNRAPAAAPQPADPSNE